MSSRVARVRALVTGKQDIDRFSRDVVQAFADLATASSGTVGPQGPAGPAGPAGATGATGAQGPAGPTSYPATGACAVSVSNTAPSTLNCTTVGTRDWFAPAGNTLATPGAAISPNNQNSNMHAKARGGWILKSFQWCCRVSSTVQSGTGPTTVSATLADDAFNTGSALSTTTATFVSAAFSNSGWGYTFRVPASTTTRTLTIYGRIAKSDAVLTVTASDGSFAAVTNTVTGNTGTVETIWTVTYNTARDGEELIVEVVCSGFYASGPQVWLVAATLA